jgi:ABC-type nitrate/sulfonate/bicarbonate transport system permease component
MRRGILGSIIPILILCAWEILSRVGTLSFDAFSRPTDIASALLSSLMDGSLLLATWQTFESALLGLAIATVVGVLTGAMLGLMPTVERITSPTIEALRPIPAVAFMPLSLMMFGFGVGMEASIVAYACVWPILIVTIGAVRAIERRLLEVAETLELSFPARLWKIILPAAFARINVGLRIAAAIAIVVAVTVEIVLNPRGLGYHLILAQQSLKVGLMYAQLFWLCVIGYLLNAALRNVGGRSTRMLGSLR